MRYLLWVFFVISGDSLADQQINTVNREMYERIIEKQFPGFRIMREDEFDAMFKGSFKDGKSGSLLFGYFDLDKNLDFAAYLIGAKRKYQADGKTPISLNFNIYDGMIVICHSEKNGNYACEKMLDSPHWMPEENEIVLVPRGTYDCMEYEKEDSHITSQFDAIGLYSEKGGGVYVHQPDGTYEMCITSD